MAQEEILRIQIEQLRKKMYQAYENNESYEVILSISTELDQLINQEMTPNINELKSTK